MWILILIVVAFGIAVFGTIAGLGILAVPVGIVLLCGAVYLVVKGGVETGTSPEPTGRPMSSTTPEDANTGTPQDEGQNLGTDHVSTGHAHAGQENMVPKS